MKQTRFFLPVLLVILIGGCQNAKNRTRCNEAGTERYFQTITKQRDIARLTLFFARMPKGGDLHHHYSGAIYAETYLEWANNMHYRIDSKTFNLDTNRLHPGKTSISFDSLQKNPGLTRAVIETWSDLDYHNHFQVQDPPDLHFFNTFNYFRMVSGANYKKGLEELKVRAKTENVQYIETMLKSPEYSIKYQPGLIDSLNFYQSKQDTIRLAGLFNLFVKMINSDPVYKPSIENYIAGLYVYHRNIDDSAFTMRFQDCVNRNSSPEDVFTKLYCCFDAVNLDHSSLLVGVNIVAPENRNTSIHDYWLHMQMFRYLKKKFPGVKTSMHAGELCMGMVKPEDLTYHIRDAVFIAHADRIGHGVDIPYETNAFELLKEMRRKPVPVEINLTSNEFILGIKGNAHPISIYYNSGVPIVISTDDAGVSRNNLTTEYVKLASRYNFTYKKIKSFVYNSIQYSFMSAHDKEVNIQRLNKSFAEFESKITCLEPEHHK
jgi:adenosine deaminase